MHTLTLVVAGLILLAVFLGAARALGRTFKSLLPIFLAIWLGATAVNMAIGVIHAGYSVAEEIPVSLVIFGVPAAAAWFLARRA